MAEPPNSIALASAAHHGQGAPSGRRTPTEASAGEGRPKPWPREATPGSEGAQGELAQRARGRSPRCGPPAAEPQKADRAAERPPSNLDTPGITGRGSRDRLSWLRDVEKGTLDHRTRQAQRLWRRAREVFDEVLECGGTREQALAARRYLLGRSNGQIRRFEQVLTCGEEKVWVVCLECRRPKETERRCRTQRLCLRCRLEEGAARRAQFARARQRARQRASDRGMLARRRLGRWSEKLLTLTLPHKASNNVGERVALLYGAWRRFSRSLSAWIRARGEAHHNIAWLRVFEWTPGNDGLGHPHFHIWILSPFLEKDTLTHWWRCALKTAGVKTEVANAAIIDLPEVRSHDGAARELIKYLTKDILPSGDLVSPKVFSELYIALDGKRVTQCSAGFFKGLDRSAECSCGAVGCFRRTLREPEVGSDGKVTDDAWTKLTRGRRGTADG